MASALFSPIKLRGLELANRIVVSPMCQYNSDNGTANDWHLMHLGQFSLGAGALVMTESTHVTPEGRISLKCAGMYSDENEAAMKRVIDFCRKYGVAKLGLAMTKADIERVRNAFADAVKRALRIGYDLIEMHAGHGYLNHEFLSPLSNRRTDEYGGSLANRMRFPLETFAAMRAAWPSDKPMGVRISATDWVDGGWNPDESVVFARELKKLGCDYVDCSSGALDPRQQLPLAPGYQVPFAERIRKEAAIPTIAVGLITSPRQCEDIVASGKADLVCLARGAMWNPRFAWHAAEELGAEAPYAPKYMACHPKLRPQVFPNRKAA